MKKSFLTILFAFASFFALGASDFSVGLDGYSWISATGTSNLNVGSDVTYSDPAIQVLPGLHLNLFLGDRVGFFGELSVNLAPDSVNPLPMNLSAGVAFKLVDDGTSQFEVGVGPTLAFMWDGPGLGVYAYPEWTIRLTGNLGLELKLGMAWYPPFGFFTDRTSYDTTVTYHYDYIDFAVTPYVGLKFM